DQRPREPGGVGRRRRGDRRRHAPRRARASRGRGHPPVRRAARLARVPAAARRSGRAAGRAQAAARVRRRASLRTVEHAPPPPLPTVRGKGGFGRPTSPGLGLVAAVVLGWAAGAVALDVPYLAGRVNDLAGVLSPAGRDRIEGKLQGLEQRTGAQVAVLVIPSL